MNLDRQIGKSLGVRRPCQVLLCNALFFLKQVALLKFPSVALTHAGIAKRYVSRSVLLGQRINTLTILIVLDWLPWAGASFPQFH